MSEWVFWILTCVASLYFVLLLLEFNKPQQKLVEQIDSQEHRHREMRTRLTEVRQETEEMSRRQEELDRQWNELEQIRKDLLPEANKRRMTLVDGGPYTMGGRDEESPNNERPSHTVYVNAFLINPFPVTNQDYREFVKVTGHRTPIHWQRGTFPAGLGNHPVTNVTWQDAHAYAEWSGARLPTEAEWEKAARGTDERPYPWGDRFVDGERCNSSNVVGSTTPVDEFPDGRSAYGLWDMAGNVFEWCHDYFDEEYYKSSPASNPRGPEGGQERVVRGGSYAETRAMLRCTHRIGAAENYNRDNTGFRIAMSAEDSRR
jgi:sulfatase modifying factor 1